MKHYRALLGTVMAGLSLAGCNGPWFGGSSGKGDEGANRRYEFSDDFARDRSSLNRGHVQFAEGNFGLALESFHAALAQDGGSVDTLNAVAATYDRIGRYDVAKKYYDRALALAPDSPRTLNNVGYSLVLQGRYDAAMQYFRLAGARDGAGVAPKADNMAMAERLAAQSPPAAPPRMAAAGLAQRQGPYIERVSTSVHTLVTKPRPEAMLALVRPEVDPRTAQAPHPAIPLALTHGGGDSLAASVAQPRSLVPQGGPAARPRPAAMAMLSLPAVEPGDTSIVPTSTFNVEISNGTGRAQMARRVRGYLELRGLKNMRLSNDASFSNKETVVFYQEGWRVAAEMVRKQLPLTARLQPEAKQAAHVRVRLGADILDFDRRELLSGNAFKGAKVRDVALAPVGGQPGPESLPPPVSMPATGAAAESATLEAPANITVVAPEPAAASDSKGGTLGWLPKWLGGGGSSSAPSSPTVLASPAEGSAPKDDTGVNATAVKIEETAARDAGNMDAIGAPALPGAGSAVPDLPELPHTTAWPGDVPTDANLLPPVPPDEAEATTSNGAATASPLSIVPKKTTTKSTKAGNAG